MAGFRAVHECSLILQYMAHRNDAQCCELDQGWCLQAPWLLMIETDYVWMKPLQAPTAEDTSAASLGFPFGYISPQAPNIERVMRKMYPTEKGPLSNVPGSGPAPALMRVDDWIKVMLQFPLSLSRFCNRPDDYHTVAMVVITVFAMFMVMVTVLLLSTKLL